MKGAIYMGFKFWEALDKPAKEAFVFLRGCQDYVDEKLKISTELRYYIDSETGIIQMVGRPR